MATDADQQKNIVKDESDSEDEQEDMEEDADGDDDEEEEEELEGKGKVIFRDWLWFIYGIIFHLAN